MLNINYLKYIDECIKNVTHTRI